jgi:hypothetical protein
MPREAGPGAEFAAHVPAVAALFERAARGFAASRAAANVNALGSVCAASEVAATEAAQALGAAVAELGIAAERALDVGRRQQAEAAAPAAVFAALAEGAPPPTSPRLSRAPPSRGRS